jgi:hypothetical protein
LSEFENSDIIKHVLDKLISISGRKTTSGNAIMTLSNSIKVLEKKYDFLKHINVKDTQFIENEDQITVMTKINNIDGNKIGMALYDIIKLININLGKQAGFYFIKELKNSINFDYNTTMIDMGVDLGLMQLEFEVKEMSKKL